MKIKNYIPITLIVFTFLLIFSNEIISSRSNEVIHVYDWYDVISKDILKEFEKKTGIKVIYDAHDSNDILEAKLLAGNSEYDVVFPSLTPYGTRGACSGIYEKINQNIIPNIKNLNPYILNLYKKSISKDGYLIPYFWGTVGFIGRQDILESFPKEDQDSFKISFDPEYLKKFSKCGISFLEEASELYSIALNYFGRNPGSISKDDSAFITDKLSKLRPYVTKFCSTGAVKELVSGNLCFSQIWSGDGIRAEEDAAEFGIKLKYVLPKEGTLIWIDCIAIPKNAPHVKNAHKFINFLLEPRIGAKLAIRTKIATSVIGIEKYLDAKTANDKRIFPPKEILDKCFINKAYLSKSDLELERNRMRLFVRLCMNKI